MPISLTTAEPKLERWNVELLRQEENLFNAGVVCSIKDLPGTTCSACPLAQTQGKKAPLCKVGKQQEQVETTMLAKRHGRNGA